MKTKHKTTLWKTLAALGIGGMSIFGTISTAKAALLYDEAVSGELSGDRFNPTVLPGLIPGNNTLRFTIANPDPLTANKSNRDLEYFTLSVPQGFLFSQLIITEYTPQIVSGGVVGTDQIAFIGIQQGTTFTEPPQPSNPPDTSNPDGTPAMTDTSNLLGYTLIGTRSAADSVPLASAGVVNAPFDDLLPAMGATVRPKLPNGLDSPIPNQGLGFVAPLPAGNYVFWAQQTAPGTATIQLDFVVSRIPEPTSVMALFVLGGLGIVSRWRCR